jgi:hypothetical protein
LAIDDNTGTKYLHFKGFSQPTGFRVTPSASQTIVVGLTFTTANDFPGRDPIAFELYGSNESIDGPYELIASGDIVDFSQRTEWPRFTMNETPILFDNGVAYDHYQILFPVLRDPGSANSMQIAEVELLGISPSHAQDVENLLANGGFEDGVPDPWSTYGDATMEVVQELAGAAVPEAPIEGDSCLHVVVGSAGANFWDAGLQHAGHVFEAGKQYTLSAFLKCSQGTLDINFKPEIGEDPWTGYGDQIFTMTDEWTEYSITTPVFTEDVSPATITFHIAFAPGDFWIDGVGWYEGEYVPDVGVKAEYFAGMTPQGTPCLTQNESSINYNWGDGEVACDRSDQVSAQWTANLEITEADTYTFATNSDDGVMVWLNGMLIIDNWTDHPETINTSLPFQLQPGFYALRMAWYENAVDAVAQLFWETPGMARQIIPPGVLQPPQPSEGPVGAGTVTGVEGFDYYTNDIAAGRAIFQTWIGGAVWPSYPGPFVPSNDSGARVGHDIWSPGTPYTTIMETRIVYSGKQSMPLYYDNSKPPFYSQADRTWEAPQNWTVGGVDTLSLQVHGQTAKFTETSEFSEGSEFTKYRSYVLAGAGADIWGMSDEFRFAYKHLIGNGSLTARIVSNGQGSNGWAKGGVMIRESLDGGSTHAMTVVTGGDGGGGSFQWRPIVNGDSRSAHDPTPAVSPPYWVRIERNVSELRGYLSPDGVNWTQQGPTWTVSMGSTVYIGLCVTSHVSGELRTYEFDNVYTTGTILGQWQVEDVGVAQPGNDPAQLYIAVEDIGGNVGVVFNSDLDLLLRDEWTRWEIPLRSLAEMDVNLQEVKKMSIGMRDPTNLTPRNGLKLFADSDSDADGTGDIDQVELTTTAGTTRVDLMGFVRNKENNSPIHKAKITLVPSGPGGGGMLSCEAYESGLYWIDPTQGASYNVSVTAEDYQDHMEPNPLKIELDTTLKDFVLTPVQP